MFEILEKIVKHLAKLDNYYVLRQEKEHIIIGTKIIIKEQREINGAGFQPYVAAVNKEFAVFFLVTIVDPSKPLEIDKIFMTNKLPILPLYNKKCAVTLDSVRNLLSNFVKDNFKY